jgi:hypothetical protein
MLSPDETTVNWKVIDAVGKVRLTGETALSKGEIIEQINISGLGPGIYYYVTNNGFAKIFVRM